MSRDKVTPSIAIIGGGVLGTATALELARSGKFKVTIIEKEPDIGGLSSSHMQRGMTIDRYYHVILPNDRLTRKFVDELGLTPGLKWRKTISGFYGQQKLVSLSSVSDFIRFPFLTIWEKLRLGFGILYSARLRDSEKLDRQYASEWLTRVFGKKVYSRIWEPLLRSKLGETYARTSAAFIWTNIVRLYQARDSGKKNERMGYVQGGFHTIWEAAKREIADLNISLRVGQPVLTVESDPETKKIIISSKSGREVFDKALLTIPNPEILRIIQGADDSVYWTNVKSVEYLGVICVLLILKRKLSPYYIINLLERDLPFTGIIESTNVHSPKDYESHHLVYLPKYLSSVDALNQRSDSQIIDLFKRKLYGIFPELKEEDIAHIKVFRDSCVQPILELNFLERKLEFRTPIPNLYLANSSMIYNSTINNNSTLSLVEAVSALIAGDSAS